MCFYFSFVFLMLRKRERGRVELVGGRAGWSVCAVVVW